MKYSENNYGKRVKKAINGAEGKRLMYSKSAVTWHKMATSRQRLLAGPTATGKA